MKTIRFKHSVLATCAALALASVVGINNAQAQYIINQFDTSAEVGQWSGGGTRSWDGTVDAGGSASHGSMHVTLPYQNVGNNWQEFQVQNPKWGSPIDISHSINLEFDIKVDVANSYTSFDGNYGELMMVIQGGWYKFGQTEVTNNGTGWQHVKCSLAGIPSPASNIIFDFASWTWNLYPTNTISYWIDNIEFTSAPLPRPTLANPIPGPKQAGLTLLPCNAGSPYQRVMVFPGKVSTALGWYNNYPISYSFTLTNFPAANDYAANVFWVPNVYQRNGTNDSSIDWNCTNGLFFGITAGTNNPAQSWQVAMQAKTNLSLGNANLTITNYNYTSLPVGTWIITFNNNTDFTITAPDSSVVSASLPADVASLVSGHAAGDTSMTPDFGIMPRANSNIGVPVVYSNIKIAKGATVLVNDNFNLGVFDTTNTWDTLADYPAGITVNAGDLAYYLAWNTPNDQGYSLLAASSLTGPWPDFAAASTWLVVNGNHQVPVTKSGLQAQLGETDVAFFRLVKRVFTKLQVLLPGETAAPNTLTGKTGTPTPVSLGAGGNEDVTVNAVDDNWNIVNSSDTITLTSSDGLAILPLDMTLVGGTVTFSGLNAVAFSTIGSQTITAADTTNLGIPAAHSASVTVGP
jgi:hypothetical protein